ncbi:MAG: hypothetical protein ACRDRR_05920 [Pseudonocardiaceae bacterium]
MPAPEIPFSELVQRPTDTVARLTMTRGQTLRLRRRDAEDLTLTTATRAEQEHTVVSATTRMFVALMQRDEAARSMLLDVVSEVFPWVRFLPTQDVRAFMLDLVETLHAADALDNPAPVVQVITAWQHTAEVHADPDLAARTHLLEGDFGPVPQPAA